MITKIDPKAIPGKRGGTIMKDLEEFIRSGMEACEVEGRLDPRVMYTSYRTAVTRKKYPVRVLMRGNRVFLIREETTA